MSRVALVVGINTYSHLPNLRASSIDAEAIAQRLAQYGDFRVIRLPEIIDNSQPKVGSQTLVTRSILRKALVQLFKPDSHQNPDTALFYFSGHGVRDILGFAEGYLATSETNPTQDNFGLSLRWLRRLLEESGVKQQIVWLDCCYSGEFLNFEEADPGDRGKGRDRCFIAASRDFEAAYEDLNSPHSVLTKVLLSGLDPQNHPDRWIDNLLLADFINQSLKTEIQSPVCNNSGEPINITRIYRPDIVESKSNSREETCPYKGLTFFDCNEEDPKYFFGRTALTDQLLDTVRKSNFLAIFGASGSGKSSVLRAGLLHQLKIGRRISKSDQWDIRLIVPGEHPLQKLALAFIDESSEQLLRAEQLQQAESLIAEGADGLRRLVQASTKQRVVIVVDQFEECFTLCQNTDERQQFFACILGALDLCPEKLRIVIAMRADFFGKCVEQEYSGLAKRIEGDLVAVKAMSRDELADAITKPAEKVEISVEPELVQEILNDLGEAPGSLPLMQYALRELWNQRQDNQLQLRDYSRLGGIMGTLRKRATAVYHGFNKQGQKATRHIFLSLTQLGEGTEDTRRRVLKQDLITSAYSEKIIDKTVQKLADANLVITSEILSKDIESQRFAVVDVAHEALIRHWPLLRTWLDADRELIRRQRKIEVLADEWQDQKHKSDYLLRGAQLVDAVDFLKKYAGKLPLSKNASNFLKRSLKRRRNIRLRYSSLLLIPLIVFEILWRENSMDRHYSKLRDRHPGNNRSSILALVNGCDFRNRVLKQELDVISYSNFIRNTSTAFERYIARLFFGNCRSLYNAHLATTDLQNLNFSYTQLGSANFSFSQLQGAILKESDVSRSNFIFANLKSADLSKSNLQYSYFRNANLDSTNLHLSDLSNVNFRDANLVDANFNKAFIDGADFSGTNLSQAQVSGAIYTLTTQFPPGFSVEEANLYLITPGIDLVNADLSFVSLRTATLDGSKIENTDFSGAYLYRSSFANSLLKKVSFQEADLDEADFANSEVDDSSFKEADLFRADFNNMHLSNSSFENSNLVRANLKGASLENVSLKGANLSSADLRGTDLRDVIIEDTNLKNAIYSLDTKFPAGFSPKKNKMLLIGPGSDLLRAKLSSVNLISENLSNTNLKRANLKGANLRDADLTGATLTNADLENAIYNVNTKFPDDFDPNQHEMYFIGPDIDLSGIEVDRIDLSYANLARTVLTNANLDHSNLSNIDLENSDLRVSSLAQADLRFANLKNANLSFTSFIDSDLTGANLSMTNLENTSFFGTNLTEAILYKAVNLTTEMLGAAHLCKTQLPEELELDPNRNCAELGISVP